MNIHSQKNNLDILRQTQENLDATQKNAELLAAVLQQLLGNDTSSGRKPKTDEEKLKAAYALNLCTVSVSQIVDYNDLAFLEHEYDAILNNLNLEEMPKDEALLRILKQLLDVITFFRIQEGDKKMLDREYQQRMKDAIWSAVPNVGVIVGTNPISTVISLASQVGIGYMNYRKEKSKALLDKEKAEWQLQRSAMEQFNGLRRELFDTAWRLADEYNFPDEFRITERQITQYNKILMDPDPLRRYERLEYIAGRFKAYPPYWYYRGNAANSVFQDSRYPEEVRNAYKENAVKDFSRFLEDTEKNLLREDQLVAACALECFDLVEDEDSKRKLLYRARSAAGNAYDVLQLCALSELKIGRTKNAAELLRMLVNEGYNTEVNAQLLSRMYVANAIESDGDDIEQNWKKAHVDYETLKSRVGDIVLFPMPECIPESEEEKIVLAERFLINQKAGIQYKCAFVLQAFIQKYEERFDTLWSMPGDITEHVISLIGDMCDSVKDFALDESDFLDIIQAIANENFSAKQMQFKKYLADSEERRAIKGRPQFEFLMRDAILWVADQFVEKLKNATTMTQISELDTVLDRFCIRNEISRQLENPENHTVRAALLGKNHADKTVAMEKEKACLGVVRKFGEAEILHLAKKKTRVDFLRRGESKFAAYFNEHSNIKGRFYSPKSVVAILADKQFNAYDLHFTTAGLSVVGTYLTIKTEIDFVPYQKIKLGKENSIKLNKGRTYKSDFVNWDNFMKFIQELAQVIERYDDLRNSKTLSDEAGRKFESLEDGLVDEII